jgi:hypothetical protein
MKKTIRYVTGSGKYVETCLFFEKYHTTVGDGVSKSYVITHNLFTQNIVIEIHRTASPYDNVDTYYEATDMNTATVYFTTAPTTNQYTVSVFG